MKKIPKLEDFELNYIKYPIKQMGGISDMNYVKRFDDRDSLYQIAKNQWMFEAEHEILQLYENINNTTKNHEREILAKDKIIGKAEAIKDDSYIAYFIEYSDGSWYTGNYNKDINGTENDIGTTNDPHEAFGFGFIEDANEYLEKHIDWFGKKEFKVTEHEFVGVPRYFSTEDYLEREGFLKRIEELENTLTLVHEWHIAVHEHGKETHFPLSRIKEILINKLNK